MFLGFSGNCEGIEENNHGFGGRIDVIVGDHGNQVVSEDTGWVIGSDRTLNYCSDNSKSAGNEKGMIFQFFNWLGR